DIIFPSDEKSLLYKPSEFVTAQDGANHCLTPQGEIGSCILASKCSVLKKLLKYKMKPKVCSWEEETPILCCPFTHLSTRRKSYRNLRPTVSTNSMKKKYENVDNCGTRKQLSEILLTNMRSRVITTGRPPVLGEYPWMVIIFAETPEGSKYLCGGTILTDRFILSAAHCFMTPHYLYTDYTIKVGTINISEGDIYKVNSVAIHPSFNPAFHYNDIAIVRIEESIQFTDKVRPICLPFHRKIHSNSAVIVTGYGSTEFGGKRSEVLLAADLNVVSNESCNKSYSVLESKTISRGITKQMMCAGSEDGKNDACQSDSGSPLVFYDTQKQRWYIVGIVSFGHRCADPKFPGVYTKVAHYIHWILHVVDLRKSQVPLFLHGDSWK
ncbi:Clotting factor B-like protein, partial [Leptotrombidium deliense]